jgi:hypothetical protein
MSERQHHQDVIKELVSTGLLHPRPRVMGFRAWSLLIPSLCASVGLFCFAVVAFSFTEMTNLSYEFRKYLVIIGAFTLATGGEVGTVSSVVECSRKRKTKQATWLDTVAVLVSAAASLAEFVIAMSFLSGFDIVESMPRIVALGVLSILDAYFSFHEFGDYLGSHDTRMEKWKKEYFKAVEKYYSLPGEPEQELVAPAGYTYQLEDRVMTSPPGIPERVETSQDGNGGLCWCGQYCESPQQYAAHVRYDHLDETLYSPENGDRYGSADSALRAMQERYKDTIDQARWEFPDLERVVEMRRKAGRR